MALYERFSMWYRKGFLQGKNIRQRPLAPHLAVSRWQGQISGPHPECLCRLHSSWNYGDCP
jgi:hypothetical protein